LNLAGNETTAQTVVFNAVSSWRVHALTSKTAMTVLPIQRLNGIHHGYHNLVAHLAPQSVPTWVSTRCIATRTRSRGWPGGGSVLAIPFSVAGSITGSK
jgi:hypothetical protein